MASELTEKQNAIVAAPVGHLRLLAGAGTGKSTVLAHRAARHIREGNFGTNEVLVVTLTRHAAEMMRHRLRDLGTPGIRIGTLPDLAGRILLENWHSWKATPPPNLIGSKSEYLSRSNRRADTPLDDLERDIEWLQRNLISPGETEDYVRDNRPPMRVRNTRKLVAVYKAYEDLKQREAALDFEDQVRACIELLDECEPIRRHVQNSCSAVIVDNYEDMTPLSFALLDHLAGESREVCVAGDPFQAIFQYSGGTSDFLLDGFLEWKTESQTFHLSENWRSTTQILDLANSFAQTMVEAGALLHGDRPGDEPDIVGSTVPSREAERLLEEVLMLRDEVGIPAETIGVLFRTTGDLQRVRRVFSQANLDHHVVEPQVPDQAWHERSHIQEALVAALAAGSLPLAVSRLESLARTARAAVITDEDADLADDLEVLLELAEESDGRDSSLDELERRVRHHRRGEYVGIRLMTYHEAVGREFEAVFLPRLQESVIPHFFAFNASQLEEERRIFYVGLTRAKSSLFLSWAERDEHGNSRSRFIADLVPAAQLRPKHEVRRANAPRSSARSMSDAPLGLRPAVTVVPEATAVTNTPPSRALPLEQLTRDICGAMFTTGALSRWTGTRVSTREQFPCPLECGNDLAVAQRSADEGDEAPRFILICCRCQEFFDPTQVGMTDARIEQAVDDSS